MHATLVRLLDATVVPHSLVASAASQRIADDVVLLKALSAEQRQREART
jgi:hypothetical protein